MRAGCNQFPLPEVEGAGQIHGVLYPFLLLLVGKVIAAVHGGSVLCVGHAEWGFKDLGVIIDFGLVYRLNCADSAAFFVGVPDDNQGIVVHKGSRCGCAETPYNGHFVSVVAIRVHSGYEQTFSRARHFNNITHGEICAVVNFDLGYVVGKAGNRIDGVPARSQVVFKP